MRKRTKTLMAATALVAGIAAAASLYADDSGNTGGHGGMMMGPGMTGQGGMMPMMERMSEMMDRMSEMMDHCSQMMQRADDGGSGAPDEQQEKTPVTPDNNG